MPYISIPAGFKNTLYFFLLNSIYHGVLFFLHLSPCLYLVTFTHVATASVLAGVAVAFVGLQLTVGAPKARPARAGVAALTRVGAGGPVGAGLVIGAVVEVLVAEEAPPTLLAVALPRLAARSVEATRVADAFIAGGALPAHATCTAPRGLAVAVLLTAVRRADGWRTEGRGRAFDYNGHALSHTLSTTRTHTHTHWAPCLTPTLFQTSLFVKY